MLVSSPARAHHGSATTRMGDVGIGQGAPRLSAPLPLPQMQSGLLLDGSHFSRVRMGSHGYDRAELGQVAVATLGMQLLLELKSRTFFGLHLPVGVVSVTDPDHNRRVAAGLGDTAFFVGQQFVPKRKEKTSPVSFMVTLGLLTPTGRYEPEAGLSLAHVETGADGSLDLLTYNVQTSLGAGSWSPFGKLGVRWQAHRRWALLGESTFVRPVTRARDGVLWGADLQGRLGLLVEVVEDRLALQPNLNYRHHFRNQVPILDAESGVTSRASVGGRDELTVGLDLSAQFGLHLSCALGARVPVWQRVAGVQLVETVGGQLGCWTRFSL